MHKKCMRTLTKVKDKRHKRIVLQNHHLRHSAERRKQKKKKQPKMPSDILQFSDVHFCVSRVYALFVLVFPFFFYCPLSFVQFFFFYFYLFIFTLTTKHVPKNFQTTTLTMQRAPHLRNNDNDCG